MSVETRIDSEKRWVASLMADIVGSTELAEQLGAENTYHLFREIMQDAWSLIAEFNGHAVEFAGDSVFALFGAPIAVENSALHACRAAVALHEMLGDRQAEYFAKYGVRPQFRIGIAGGEVLVADMDLGNDIKVNALGSTVNLSARLQTQGQGGEILCSESILEEVEGAVASKFLGKRKFKGYRRWVPIYKITHVERGGSSFNTRFRRGAQAYVGRDEQRDMLLTWMTDDRQGSPTMLVRGPAGIGKSRLLYEVRKRAGAGVAPLIGNCSLATMQRPLTPLLEIIRTAAGIAGDSTQEQVAAALKNLSGADEKLVATLVRLFLDGLSTPDAADHDSALTIRHMITRIISDLMTDRGSLVVIEDAHWIDPLSADILQGLIAERMQDRKLLLLARNENDLSWAEQDDVRRIDLLPLTRADISELTASLFNDAAPDKQIVELLFKQSEGNPLFVEEILRHLRHQSDGENKPEMLKALEPSSIGSLQNLVFSRFDRLGEVIKQFLRKASVIGRDFSVQHLQAMGMHQAAIENGLAVAEQSGLVEVDRTASPLRVQFSHALVHDAIYNSIPLAERRPLHAEVAQVFEEMSDDQGHALSEVLAEHYIAAGMAGKALKYIYISAQKAFRVYALDTCDFQLTRAFEMIDRRPNSVDDATYGAMLILWARALDIVVNYVKMERVLSTYLTRLQHGAPTTDLALGQMFIAKCMCHGGRYDQSLAQGEYALEMAKRIGNEHTIAMTKVILMRIYVDSGYRSHADVVDLFEKTREIGESGVDPHLSQMRLYFMQTSFRRIGRLRECERLNDALYRFGDEHNDSRACAYASWSRTVLGRLKDNAEATMIAARETFKYTIPGTGDWRVASVSMLGARVADGDETVTMDQFEVHAAKCKELGDMTLYNATLFQIVIAQFTRGNIRDGWRRLQEYMPQFERTGCDEHSNFVLLVQAEFYLSVAGLLRKQGERPRLGIMDLLQVLKLKPFARKRSEQLFKTLMARVEGDCGFMIARCKQGLGLLARARGEAEDARTLFAESIALFEAEDMDKDVRRVRGYLT